MAQQTYQVNLLFNADTGLAQQNMQKLAADLNKIKHTRIAFDNGPLAQAAQSAEALSVHLQNAVNTNTGKLDLVKFNTSLKSSGANLNSLMGSLTGAGAAGEQAFAKIAIAIAQAETPLMHFGTKTKALLQTFSNTIKWQIASSAIQGFTSSIRDSIQYVEKFDKALTDIKIVSDLNNDSLLKFAKNTREIAKEVNGTALEIAQGSAIYFQQGLTEQQVTERIAITAKMAHVTGESTEKISSQLTAIWNNFDDGTETLESYADILTYLGAKTAADTNQIATAMQKFAASARTVGLSYEYASSMVAEVIDRTQMAPEEVGTAMKTILTRLQDVKLGETLEDGVELSKYTSALSTVGVQVLDINGELRDADDILSDLGEKWDTLDTAQKRALATTVAGVRQTTQFIALMEEWDDVESSVSGLANSTDYLNKKNEEWANNIEGIKKRYEEVKQELASKLLDDNLIKGFYKGLIGLVETAGGLVDSFGGLGPMVLTLAAIFSQRLTPVILNLSRSVVGSFRDMLGMSNTEAQKLVSSFQQMTDEAVETGLISQSLKEQLSISQQLTNVKNKMASATQFLGDREKEIVKMHMTILENATMEVNAQLDKKRILEEQNKLLQEQAAKTNAKNIGERLATDKFRAKNKEMSQEEQDDFIEDTRNSNLYNLNRNVDAKQQEMNARSSLAGNQQEIDKRSLAAQNGNQAAQNDIVRLQEQQKQNLLEIAQLNQSIFTAEEKSLLTKYKEGTLTEEEQQALEKIKQKIIEGTKEEQKQFDLLKKKRDLKEDMVRQEREFSASTVVAKGEKETFRMKGDGPKGVNSQESNAIVNSALSQVQGVSVNMAANGDDVATYDVSIEKLGQVAKAHGELSVKVSDVSRKSQEFQKVASKLDFNKIAKSNEKLTKGLSKTGKETDKTTKGFGKLTSAFKKTSSAEKEMKLSKSEKEMLEFGASVKKTAQELLGLKKGSPILKEIDQAMEQLKSSNPEEVKQGVDKLKNALITLEATGQDSLKTTDFLIDQLYASLDALGMNTDDLDKLESEFINMGMTAEQAKNAVDRLKQKFIEAGNASNLVKTGFTGLMTTTASLLGQVQMLYSGFTMLANAFAEDATWGERFGSIISGLIMILPVFTSFIGAVSLAKKKETVETSANTLAQLINWAAKGPAGWAILAGCLVAITALTIGMAMNTAATKENTEATQENTSAQEDLDKTINGVIDAYYELIDVAGKYQELAKGSQEWIDALEKENELINQIKASLSGAELQEFNSKIVIVNGYQTMAPGDLKDYENHIKSLEKKKNVYRAGSSADSERKWLDEHWAEVFQQPTNARDQLGANYEQIMVSTAKKVFQENKNATWEDVLAQYGQEINAEIDWNYDGPAMKAAKRLSSDKAKEYYRRESAYYNSTWQQGRQGALQVGMAQKDASLYDTDHIQKDFLSSYGFQKELNKHSYSSDSFFGDSGYAKGVSTEQGKIIQSYLEGAGVIDVGATRSTEKAEGNYYIAADKNTGKMKAISSKDGTVLKEFNAEDVARYGQNEYIANEGTAKYQEFLGGINNFASSSPYASMIADAYAAGDINALSKDAVDYIKGLTEAERDELFKSSDSTGAVQEIKNFVYDQSNGVNQWNESKHSAALEKVEANKENYVKSMAAEQNLDPEIILQQAEAYRDLYSAQGMTLEQAGEIAVANGRMNRGIKALNENWEDYYKILKKGDKTSADWISASKETSKQLKDILNLTGDMEIPEEFYNTKNIELLNAALNGSEEAVTQLGHALNDSIIESEAAKENPFEGKMNELKKYMQDNDLMVKLGLDADNFEESFEAKLTSVRNKLSTATDQLQAQMANLAPGADVILSDDFVNALNEMAILYGWTMDDMKNYLENAELDVPAEAITEETGLPRTTVETVEEQTVEKIGGGFGVPETYRISTKVVDQNTVELPNTAVTVPQLNIGKDSQGNQPKITKKSRGNIDNSSLSKGGGGGGGGGGTPQKKAPVKKKKEKDEIERYHEISQAVEQQSRSMERLSKAKDLAYGDDKLKAMEAEIEATRELIALNEIYLDEIRDNLALDKAKARSFGIEIDDESGLITNYEKIIRIKMDEWHTEAQALQDEEYDYEVQKNADENYDATGEIKRDIEARKEANDEAYEEFKEAISQYEESLNLFEDKMDELAESYRQIAEKILEGIEYKIQTNVEFNNQEISVLDFQATLLQDDFSKVAEAVHLAGEEFQFLNSNIDYNAEGIRSLFQNYADGKITLSDVSMSLSTLIPDLLSSMEALISLDQEMMEAYGNAFDNMEEEFSEFLTDLDYGVEKLQYIRDLSSLLGKESDNAWMGTILNAQYKTASDRLTASTKWYDLAKQEYDALYTRYINEKDNLAANNPKALEMLEEELGIAQTKLQEADAQRLADMQTTGELAQEILQNNLDKARKTLEQNILGSSIDDYMTQLDRLSKKQEEYLTNTNKLYETSKLMRQAQLDMDKTDSLRAKEKYKEYMDYIGQLKEAGQVSQHELSIAQAKYELLQAEIALEEAQNNKNSMRLVRGADGNWSYAYTANQDQVSQAQQNLEDKQNALYNIGLEGAQDYQSKAAEILQEANDTFATLQEQYQTGEIASREEFEQKMLEARNYYYGLLQNYDELYHISLDTMQENSHENTIDYQLSNIDIYGKFAENVDKYLDDVNISLDDYDGKMDIVRQEVGGDLDTLSQKTGAVNTETGALVDTIENEFLPTAKDQLSAVREQTTAWGLQRDSIYDVIKANRILITQMKEIQELQLGRKDENLAGYLVEKLSADSTLGADDRIVQEILARRWEKMGGVDNNDYTTLIANAKTPEEKRAYEIMRDYKIDRTDWTAKINEAKAADPNADVSWMEELQQIKLSRDWEAKIKQYVMQNQGLRYNDEYLQEMLNIRALTEAHNTKSNKELLKELGDYIIGEEIITEESKDQTSSSESTSSVENNANEETVQTTIQSFPNVQDSVTVKDTATNWGSKSGGKRMDNWVRGSTFTVGQVDQDAKQILLKKNGGVTGWINVTDLEGYRTGGYTGAWGPEGKLALLHEKELVLNAHDTENILASVELIRGITETLIGNAGATTSMLATILQASSANGTHDVVQQTVSIEASFPGVQSAIEIEEALNNLVNDAVQYASVKKL